MNGIELVRRMKAEPRLQSMPVVIVSYKDREEDRRQGLEAGANYYLTKSSFHDETLIQAVQELIGRASGKIHQRCVLPSSTTFSLATEVLRRVVGSDPRHTSPGPLRTASRRSNAAARTRRTSS